MLFALRGVLIYGLVVVDIQANYTAATTPLRFGALPVPGSAEALPETKAGANITESAAPLPMAAPGSPTPPAEAEASPRPANLPPELLPWRDKLRALVAAEQPWLEPELTLTELAQRLRTNPGTLSKVIKWAVGKTSMTS